MVLFSVIESVFFISLAITFILILLLVYHFKQRILSLEQKSENMFLVVNSLVKEYTNMRSFLQMTNFSPSTTNPMSFVYEQTRKEEEEKEAEEEEEKIVVSDDDEDEDEDEDEDAEDDDADEDENENDEVEVDTSIRLISLDSERETYLNEIVEIEREQEEEQEQTQEQEKEQTQEQTQEKEIEGIKTPEKTQAELYEKMSTAALKSLVTSKGLSTDATKMRRPALLELLNR
uniref:Rho termination factor N-terminal domain-containing protein n=1 Tax=viral metagenome TaxID=1070528 RepID=A0A6C0I3H1_9ZZZZ